MYNKGCTLALARLMGGNIYPDIEGTVYFKDVPGGTEVEVEVFNLPPYSPFSISGSPIGPHGFHIHEFGCCMITDPNEPFECSGEHWNPTNQPHGSVYSLEKLIDGRTLVTNHVVNDKDGQS